MKMRPDMSTGTAEVSDSRLEPAGVVTDSRDQSTTGALSKRAERAPVERYAGELEQLIIWKISHIVGTGCRTCHRELGELLADWRSQSEPQLPPEAA